MKQIEEVAGYSLQWKLTPNGKSKIFRNRNFELWAGEDIVARFLWNASLLSWRSVISFESSEGRWLFKRSNKLFGPIVVVQSAETEVTIGSMFWDFNCKRLLKLPNGRTYEYGYLNVRSRSPLLAFVDENGDLVILFDTVRAQVDIARGALGNPDLTLLIAMSLFLVITVSPLDNRELKVRAPEK